jgi:hypothetical protein
MLIGNGARLASNPMRQYSGVGVTNDMLVPLPSAGSLRNSRAIYGKLASMPRGKQAPYAWLMPFKSGDMTSFGEISGAGLAALNVDLGINITGSPTGSGQVSSADLSLLVSLISSLVGSGEISAAAMDLFADLAASITGAGSITGTLEMLAWIDSTINGDSTITASLFGDCFLGASITSAGDVVTAASCAQAVMDATIEGGLTLEDVMKVLLAIAAGKTDITDLGGGEAIVKFRDVNDTTDRVTANMTGSERTSVTLDTE